MQTVSFVLPVITNAFSVIFLPTICGCANHSISHELCYTYQCPQRFDHLQGFSSCRRRTKVMLLDEACVELLQLCSLLRTCYDIRMDLTRHYQIYLYCSVVHHHLNCKNFTLWMEYGTPSVCNVRCCIGKFEWETVSKCVFQRFRFYVYKL